MGGMKNVFSQSRWQAKSVTNTDFKSSIYCHLVAKAVCAAEARMGDAICTEESTQLRD